MTDCKEWLELEGKLAPVHFLRGYIPSIEGGDILSDMLIRFKNNHYPTKKFWLNTVFTTFNELLQKDESDLLTRSLSHHELKVNLYNDYKTPLGYLCTRTAKLLKSRYAAGMIHKINPTPPLKGLSRDDRWNTIKDNFQVADGFNRRRFKQFWFVDDVITTGATARAVWKALLKFYPDIDFRVFALARVVHNSEYNKDSTLISDWNKIKDLDHMVVSEPELEYNANIGQGRIFSTVQFDNSDTFFV